jgi:hypothetical protein
MILAGDVRRGSDHLAVLGRPGPIIVDFSGIEVLYRHNLHWARANLFKHFVRRREYLDWADPEVSATIQKDLGSYCG